DLAAGYGIPTTIKLERARFAGASGRVMRDSSLVKHGKIIAADYNCSGLCATKPLCPAVVLVTPVRVSERRLPRFCHCECAVDGQHPRRESGQEHRYRPPPR